MQFKSPSSSISPTFFTTLSSNKLTKYKLSNSLVEINSVYSKGSNFYYFDSSSFDSRNSFNSLLLNTNTFEEFKQIATSFSSYSSSTVLHPLLDSLLSAINDGSILSRPYLIQKSFVLAHSDLKKFIFYYWVSWPVLSSSLRSTVTGTISDQIGDLTVLYDSFVKQYPLYAYFFIINVIDDQVTLSPLTNHSKTGKTYFAFIDPSNCAEAGWPLRNYLVVIKRMFNLNSFEVVCFKDGGSILKIEFLDGLIN